MAHRFYIPLAQCTATASHLTLEGGEAEHALRVLRLRRGDKLTVLNGAGGEFTCVIESHDKHSAELRVLERQIDPELPASISLVEALPKGKLFETIIQKATELGASRVVPLLTERVIAQLDSDGAQQKAAKWQQVGIEAVKQCGARWLPSVEAPVSLSDYLARKEPFELPLVASLLPGSRHPREWFRSFYDRHQRTPKSLAIFIGPEGDFTPAEVEAIERNGALPITLGPLTLRTDTAALYSLSVVNYELRAPRQKEH